MGCCISKCKPKPKPQYNSSVQDKLVISQSPPSSAPPSPPRKRKTIQSPPSITSASYSCSTQSSTCGSSLSSASSSSSLVVFPKVDHSFSNDFLQTCAMENPQIVHLHPSKKIEIVKQSGPSSTQKRARAGSPILTRQKSIRVEKEGLSSNSNGRSVMRSPSPSRRFSGNTSNNYQRQTTLFSTKTLNNESNCMAKSNIRAASPTRNVICKGKQAYLKNKERFGFEEIGSKVEIGKVLSKVNYSGSVPMEDLDNPHIALDCFIFL